MKRLALLSCIRCERGGSAVPVVAVITSVWDIPRLCECEWIAPDYGKRQRAWRRIPDPSCPYCIRSATSRAWATPIGVAA